MDDDHRDVHRLGDTQQAADGLGLQKVGAGLGWQCTPFSPFALLFGDERVDDPGVLAVYAADAALFRFSFFSALYISSSPIIMAGYVIYILKDEMPSAYISSISLSMVSFQSSMVMWKP